MAVHRWVTQEPDIPFALRVMYEDDNIIVVDKPHFLPTMPRGMWYRSSALMRLRERYDDERIVPAHRLDRQTAGVLVFVRNPDVRGAYQTMFQRREPVKTYECIAPLRPAKRPKYGTVRRLDPVRPFPLVRASHIEKRRGVLQAYEIPETVNARTLIERGGPVEYEGARWASYTLHPHTGKTHQLRVHMNALGLPIAGDDWYPVVRPYDYVDFSHPLQLVARSLAFTDPVSGEARRFESTIPLGNDGSPLQ